MNHQVSTLSISMQLLWFKYLQKFCPFWTFGRVCTIQHHPIGCYWILCVFGSIVDPQSPKNARIRGNCKKTRILHESMAMKIPCNIGFYQSPLYCINHPCRSITPVLYSRFLSYWRIVYVFHQPAIQEGLGWAEFNMEKLCQFLRWIFTSKKTTTIDKSLRVCCMSWASHRSF